MNRTIRRGLRAMVAAFTLVLFGALAETACGDYIQFTVTGTANSDIYGYVAGQSYSFHWILNSAFSQTPETSFSAIENYWSDEYVSETPTFVDVRGDGLTGAWQRPTVSFLDPYSYVDVWNPSGTHRVILYAGNDSHYATGLQMGGTDIQTVEAESMTIGNIFTFPETYIDPTAYFSGLAGNYSISGGTLTLYALEGPDAVFTPTSLTISMVPEPSTILLTGFGLVAILSRRRVGRRHSHR